MAFASSITADESRQQFLRLLVTQVQHQDPLDPVNQQDFIQQLAQFSTLEGIENLNAQFGDMLALQQLTNGTQLVGQTVRYQTEEGAAVGTVTEVASVDNRLMLTIGKNQVPIDRILAVLQPAA